MNASEFEAEVYNWIKRYELLREGDIVFVGVSGGADSVALLHCLLAIEKQLGVTLRVIHVEHGIRGEESVMDAAFTENLCNALGIECKVTAVGNQIKQMTDTHMSPEEKARIARYRAFEKEAEETERRTGSRVRIAVAHHANDNVETVLFHLIRGTGLDGLRGMPVKRERIIRPFLGMERRQIEAYLEEKRQSYREDATNAEIKYDRNKLRHGIMPQLEEINAGAVRHMNQTALLLGEFADYIRQETDKALREATISDREAYLLGEIDAACIKKFPAFLQKEILHAWIGEFIAGAKDIGEAHIRQMEELLCAQTGKRICLPKEMTVVRTYRGLGIYKNEADREEMPCSVVLEKEGLAKNETIKIAANGKKYQIRVFTFDNTKKIPTNLYTKWLDYDKIKNNVHLRGRTKGDYMTISAKGGTKKLQDYFVNEKIPAGMRDDIPLFCDGNHVMWVVGYRMSEYYKITQETKNVLEIQLTEEKENE